jgi:hypothetical protein
MKNRKKIPDDVIPWTHLNDSQRKKFAESFLTKKARAFREKALKASSDSSHSLECRRLLHLYQKLIRWQKDHGVEITTQEIEVREMLKNWFIISLVSGGWDELAWLAKFGKEHCAEGLLKVSDKTIPAYATENDEMAAVALREFARISGISFDRSIQLIEPLIPAPPSDGSFGSFMKRMSHKSPPKQPAWIEAIQLPTKSLLCEKTLKEWQRLTGVKPKDASSLFSRVLKNLGLAGLPDGRGIKKPLSKQSLTETGQELLESLQS